MRSAVAYHSGRLSERTVPPPVKSTSLPRFDGFGHRAALHARWRYVCKGIGFAWLQWYEVVHHRYEPIRDRDAATNNVDFKVARYSDVAARNVTQTDSMSLTSAYGTHVLGAYAIEFRLMHYSGPCFYNTRDQPTNHRELTREGRAVTMPRYL